MISADLLYESFHAFTNIRRCTDSTCPPTAHIHIARPLNIASQTTTSPIQQTTLTHQARVRSDDGKVPTRRIRRLATRPQATPLRIGGSRPDLPEMEGDKEVKARVGFRAWAAHLEGAEAGGDSVHGRRFLWPSGSMESSPAARRRRGMEQPGTREGDGDRP